jgi:hypothetical protein
MPNSNSDIHVGVPIDKGVILRCLGKLLHFKFFLFLHSTEVKEETLKYGFGSQAGVEKLG